MHLLFNRKKYHRQKMTAQATLEPSVHVNCCWRHAMPETGKIQNWWLGIASGQQMAGTPESKWVGAGGEEKRDISE